MAKTIIIREGAAGLSAYQIALRNGLSPNVTEAQWIASLGGGGVRLGAAGAGLSIREGSNAAMGTATLSAGTVTVSNTLVTSSSRIFLTPQTLGTVSVPSACGISARSAGTSFTILCSQATDTSVIAWQIVEPAP